jgi:hypothetical protein
MAATIVGPISASPGLAGGVSAANNITAVQVIKAAPGIAVRISCITAGSLTLNDSATLGGIAATNAFFSGSLTAGQVVELDWPCSAGITVGTLASFVGSIAFT